MDAKGVLAMRRALILIETAFAFVMVQACVAGGILPDRVNKVSIHGRFTDPAPEFLLIFSAQPLRDGKGQLIGSLTEAELAKVQESKENVCIRVSGKQPSRAGQLDYSFGTGEDGNQPWNNGQSFQWQDLLRQLVYNGTMSLSSMRARVRGGHP
jgi:hypothetical protein